LSDELLSSVVQSLLLCVEDAHSTVRKQAIRGLGQLVFLWHQGVAQALLSNNELSLGKVLPALCAALDDSGASVQKEAVVGVQRACQVETVPLQWRQLLLQSSRHLQPLMDVNDVALRGASLDLIGKLCVLAGPQGLEEDEQEGPDLGDFSMNLELLLVNCVIRLEDSSSAVASAAARCLRHLVVALRMYEAAVAEAAELLQRREMEQMDFEQFVFPFVALIHRADDAELVARRLEICRTYFALGSDTLQGAAGAAAAAAADSTPAPASGGSALSLSTCIAAGFVAASFARCLDETATQSRPSMLLCGVCKDLMALVVVEDSDFRASIARILGFFDILTRPGCP
jgi:hypothetical protein